jgi:N-acetylglucosamine kinase-like BadF-type ATPase
MNNNTNIRYSPDILRFAKGERRKQKQHENMTTKLIADSGSTKTDWCLMEQDGTTRQVQTKGLNPFQLTEADMVAEIKTALLPKLHTQEVAEMYFYGAGCTVEKQPLVEGVLRSCMTITGTCEVASDMLGAARAICGHRPGIACILGTGSNSCAFDGSQITKNVPPLGYILGDEGSGAVLGRTLLGDIMKHQLPQHIIDKFYEQYALTNADIIERVYRQKTPNRFLASFAPFLKDNIAEPRIEAIVKDGFRQFLRRNVRQYRDCNSLPIGFIGSIALVFRAQLEAVMHEEKMNLGRIIQAPMDGLIEFHR